MLRLMKSAWLFLCCALLLERAASAQTTITAANGGSFRVSEWSMPETMSLPSAGGRVPALSRNRVVTRENAYGPSTQTLRCIYCPALKQMWIGEATDHYVVAGEQIWSLSASQVCLAIQPSETIADSARDPESILTTFMAKDLNDPWPELWRDGRPKQFDLSLVFGCKAIRGPRPSSYPGTQYLRITNTLVSSKGVTVAFGALQSGLGLSITLSPDFKIVEARLGGVRYPVLFDGQGWLPEMTPWVGLDGKSLPSPQGDQAALFSHRAYTRINDSGIEEGFAGANAGVVVTTGEMWIGPSDCDYFVFNGQIHGFFVNADAKEIQIFKDSRGRLPLDQGTAAAFAERILKFEREFKAKQHRFEPAYKVNIFSLFPNGFSDDCEVFKRAVYMKNGNIVIKLNTGNAAAYPEIIIGPDLRVLSARVIPGGSPELNAR